MQNYIYNLGIETSKLMNSIYSMVSINTYTKNFIYGDNAVVQNKPIFSLKRSLPTSLSGITGSLFLQHTVSKNISNNTYVCSTGSYVNTSYLLSRNDRKYSKFSVAYSGSNIYLYDDKIYGVFSNIDRSLTPNYIMNTSVYNDASQVIYFSNIGNMESYTSFEGFAADSYLSNFTQTNIGKVTGLYLQSTVNSFNNTSSAIASAFSDLIEACADFAEISYAKDEVKQEFGDYSNPVIASFAEFAGINLSV